MALNRQLRRGAWVAIVAVGVFVTWPLIHSDEGLDLRMAANAGDLQRVSALLEKHPGIINSRDVRWLNPSARGWTNAPQEHLLFRQLFSKYMLNQARSLVDTNVEITSQGPVVTCAFGLHEVNGGTALHQAVFGRHVETVQLLLKKGADPNVQDRAGATPLIAAVWTEQDELVEILLASGADPNIRDHSGTALLEDANLRKRIRHRGDAKMFEGDEKIVRLLKAASGKNEESSIIR